MDSNLIPTNAQKIIDLRKRGYKPDEMIIVSLVGKIDELNHVIYADYRKSYDWKFLAGLEVCIFASSAVDYAKTLKSIGMIKTRFLALWDVDRLEGAEFWRFPSVESVCKPKELWEWKLIPNIWIPMQNKMFNGEICN